MNYETPGLVLIAANNKGLFMTNHYTIICFYDYKSSSQERTSDRKAEKAECHAGQ